LNDIRAKLIAAGVKNLKTFGYPEVTSENLLTDPIYRAFFNSMLNDNLGQAGEVVDQEIRQLLKETA
jgi:hypothetical protein